jgi:redox-sensing transcriptional repressor
MERVRVPPIAIGRLSEYLRALERFEREGEREISSWRLAGETGINPAHVRRDLTYFGQFGRPGVGYEISRLRKKVASILGLGKEWKMALVGVGNLGTALSSYKPFKERGFMIIALFDNDEKKFGKRRGILTIQDIKELPVVVGRESIEIGLITVPARSAQEVADALVAAGIRAILNLAPARISVPERIRLVNVDSTVALERVSYFLSASERK